VIPENHSLWAFPDGGGTIRGWKTDSKKKAISQHFPLLPNYAQKRAEKLCKMFCVRLEEHRETRT